MVTRLQKESFQPQNHDLCPKPRVNTLVRVCTPHSAHQIGVCIPKASLEPTNSPFPTVMSLKTPFSPPFHRTPFYPQNQDCTCHTRLAPPKALPPKHGLQPLKKVHRGMHPKVRAFTLNRVFSHCCTSHNPISIPFAPQISFCPQNQGLHSQAPRPCTHRHLPLLSPVHHHSHPMCHHHHPLHLRVLLLQGHCDKLQLFFRLTPLQLQQQEGAGSPKIPQVSIESAVSPCPQNLALSAGARVAPQHPILHCAFLVTGAAWSGVTLQPPIFRADAATSAGGLRVKLHPPWVVAALQKTATLGERNAMIPAPEKSRIAETAFRACGDIRAVLRSSFALAGGGAGGATELIVLVWGAHEACQEGRRVGKTKTPTDTENLPASPQNSHGHPRFPWMPPKLPMQAPNSQTSPCTSQNSLV